MSSENKSERKGVNVKTLVLNLVNEHRIIKRSALFGLYFDSLKTLVKGFEESVSTQRSANELFVKCFDKLEKEGAFHTVDLFHESLFSDSIAIANGYNLDIQVAQEAVEPTEEAAPPVEETASAEEYAQDEFDDVLLAFVWKDGEGSLQAQVADNPKDAMRFYLDSPVGVQGGVFKLMEVDLSLILHAKRPVRASTLQAHQQPEQSTDLPPHHHV